MLAFILSSVELEGNGKIAFENVYYTYRNLLFAVAKSIVGNNTDAEDVLQNAFVKIAKIIGEIKDINSAKTKSFLIVITKNTAYDFLRREKKHSQTVYFEELPEIGNIDLELENCVKHTAYTSVCENIKALPSPYTEVLYFHYVCDYSVKKTAKLLDRKVSTVKTQLVRGKKILLEALSVVQHD